MDVDFSDTNILITSLVDSFPGFFTLLEFSDRFGTIPHIVDVTLNPVSNWAGFGQENVSLPNGDRIVLTLPREAEPGQQISLDLTAVAPEPSPMGLPVINEFVQYHDSGNDDKEFIEIFGMPNTDYSNYTILNIEGNSPGTGLIDNKVYQVGTTDANGIWVTPFQNNILENDTNTLLLVSDFTGSINDDIDTDDDGVIDTVFWTSIADRVAATYNRPGDRVYSTTVLSWPGFALTGASRIPNGIDTNSPSDWRRNTFFFYQQPRIDEAFNTPGEINRAPVPEPRSLVLLVMVVWYWAFSTRFAYSAD